MPLEHISALKTALRSVGAKLTQLKNMGYSPRDNSIPIQKPQIKRDSPAEVVKPQIVPEEKPASFKKERKPDEKATKDNIDYEYTLSLALT